MVAAGFDEIRVRYGTHLVAALIAALGEWEVQAPPASATQVCLPSPPHYRRLTSGLALGVPSGLAEFRENIC